MYHLKNLGLEDDLLTRLSNAGDDILSDVELVENLEYTKKTAADIELKVAEAKSTSVEIDKARELYRPVAARASVLYFILNDLFKINPIYQFSLKAFNVVFHVAIERALNLMKYQKGSKISPTALHIQCSCTQPGVYLNVISLFLQLKWHFRYIY